MPPEGAAGQAAPGSLRDLGHGVSRVFYGHRRLLVRDGPDRRAGRGCLIIPMTGFAAPETTYRHSW